MNFKVIYVLYIFTARRSSKFWSIIEILIFLPTTWKWKVIYLYMITQRNNKIKLGVRQVVLCFLSDSCLYYNIITFTDQCIQQKVLHQPLNNYSRDTTEMISILIQGYPLVCMIIWHKLNTLSTSLWRHTIGNYVAYLLSTHCDM